MKVKTPISATMLANTADLQADRQRCRASFFAIEGSVVVAQADEPYPS